MNKPLIISFVIIFSLVFGSILVYANNKKLLKFGSSSTDINSQTLTGVKGVSDQGDSDALKKAAQQSALNQTEEQVDAQNRQVQAQNAAQQQQQPQVQVKDQVVTDSSKNNNMTNTEVKELKIEDIKVGGGAEVKTGDTVEVNYLGTLLDGRKFDSSYDRNQTFSFKVGEGSVIQGWDKGLVGMKVGGKRKLIIPSGLAYGEQGAGGLIEPNSALVFEIELVGIK